MVPTRPQSGFSLVGPKQSEVPAKAGIHLQRGFSLVELSIVLVILGLLVGGVLAGQSLIRAAELRAVSTEYSRWVTATQTFRDKYFALPGDFLDGTRFWGRHRNTGDCVANTSAAVATPGTCDGDGDGLIDIPTAAWNPNVSGENYQYWRQLQLAGLIEGDVTGYSNAVGVTSVSTEAPISKLTSAAWYFVADMTWFGSAAYPSQVTGRNAFFLGRRTPGGLNGVLNQEEMWNIDLKIDDGIPTSGNILSRIQGWGGAGACVTGNPFPTNGVYQLRVKSLYCTFVAINDF